MRAATQFATLLALAASCRVVTAVEVETRVEADGSGSRSLTVQSRWEDGRDEEATLPKDFLPPGAGYALLESGKERVVASASFARLADAAQPFTFGSGAARTAFITRFRAVDWVLFTIIHYEEAVVDATDPDDLRAALEECAVVALEVGEAACLRVFGEEFDDTLLRDRMRGDLREVARDLAFTIWQEFYAGSADLDALLARALPRLKPAGLDLPAKWLNDEEAAFGFPKARAAIALWVEAQLLPRREGARVSQPIGLESTLFEGAFAAEVMRALDLRFGGAEGRKAWWEAMEPRLKGSFGAGRDDVRFLLRVRMPGTLMRSDGWLEPGESSFVEFAGHEAFPKGRGIRCASVVWSGAAQSALPSAGLLPDNAAALSWTRLLGGGPDSAPQPELAALVRACVEARSLGPLEELADNPQHELAPAAARALSWLEGER
ncbi:MAG: hypothetical protein O3A20_07690 [Planctomycetota bacterium]|nr:hypothetical protein [Planctomycetota bacterium]